MRLDKVCFDLLKSTTTLSSTEDGEWTRCAEKTCEERVKNHAWGRIKAEGWFFTKKGKAYCPSHIPAWVEKWREKRRR